jgi:hypothetical protein
MPALRTSHETNASAPFVIPNPKNEYWGSDGDGTITKPIAPTQWQSHSQSPISILDPSCSREIPRSGPHRLLGHNWPSSSNDLDGAVRPGGIVGRGQGRVKGKHRVVPYTRVGKRHPVPAEVINVKTEPVSPSPDSADISINDSHHPDRQPEPIINPMSFWNMISKLNPISMTK